MPALLDHLHVLKKEQTPADKAEKARQKIASLGESLSYQTVVESRKSSLSSFSPSP